MYPNPTIEVDSSSATPLHGDRSASPGRVLLVDDSSSCRLLLRQYLAPAGYRIDEAANGIEALKAVQGAAYDVVVSDLAMPGLDGFGLLGALKRAASPPEVVLLTGEYAGDQESAIRALRMGAHDFLLKPPESSAAVRLAVARAVETKRLRETNQRLIGELQALSRTDALTGLLNRRSFDATLTREVARAQRHALPLSIGILDLDHFKKINDEHGHAIGDQVLKAFARVATGVFRRSDMVFRVGGEEFAVVLPHAPLDGAVEAVRRLIQTLRSTAIESSGVTLWASASGGVAELDGADDAESLLARADAALYGAKRAGRARVALKVREARAA